MAGSAISGADPALAGTRRSGPVAPAGSRRARTRGPHTGARLVPAGRSSRHPRLPAVRASSADSAAATDERRGLLVEVDKVLIDAHTTVHRKAFNVAFQDLGYKGTKWSPETFFQLQRSSAATPESLVRTYFNTVGWPAGVPASRHGEVTERIQQRKNEVLAAMVEAGEVPLRPGAREFMEEAAADGAAISVLSSTCSAPSERLVDAALTALGGRAAASARVFQCPQGNPYLQAPEAGAAPEERSLEDELRAATAQKRQEEAEAFLDTVNRSKLGPDWRRKLGGGGGQPGQLASRHVGEGLAIDPGLLVAAQRFAGLSPAWLAACVATLGVSVRRVAMLGGSNMILGAAQGSGMLSVAVPASFSGRGKFDGADLVVDGFGAGGGATWSGLSRKLDAQAASGQKYRHAAWRRRR